MSRRLQPGITIPDFTLPDGKGTGVVSAGQFAGKKRVLVFFPSALGGELSAQLVQFQARAADFAAQEAVLLGITDGDAGVMQRLPFYPEVAFAIALDRMPSGETAARFGAMDEAGELSPTVIVTDENGIIVRIYSADKYPHLPNPAAVLRGMKNLAEIPRPSVVTAKDWQRGPQDAPVVVIDYADYQCSPCREAYRLLRQALPRYKDRIRWVHRHLPLRHSHSLAQGAAEAAEAAGAQHKFWEMHDRLFEADGALEREQLIRCAGEIGLDLPRFMEDLDSRRYKDAVDEDFKLAVKNKIKLPPALFVNTLPFEGPRTLETLCGRIEGLLACVDDGRPTSPG